MIEIKKRGGGVIWLKLPPGGGLVLVLAALNQLGKPQNLLLYKIFLSIIL